MAELIREAIDAYLVRTSSQEINDALARCFGLWKDRTDIADAEAYVRELRRSWRGRLQSFYQEESADSTSQEAKSREKDSD